MVKFRSFLSCVKNSIIAVLMVSAVLSACSTKNAIKNINSKVARAITDGNAIEPPSVKVSQSKFRETTNYLEIKSRIMNQYASWKGVRYQFGGNTKKGIDCSAFVQRTFREQFGLELPRSTYKQKETGEHISRSNLRTGDLILFRAGSNGRHIGIYIGNNQFIHASSSNGVMISNLNKPYWKKHYNEARRVLKNS